MSAVEIAQKLRNTGKGRLSYERESSGQKIKYFLKECSSQPSLQVSPKFSENLRSQNSDRGKENAHQMSVTGKENIDQNSDKGKESVGQIQDRGNKMAEKEDNGSVWSRCQRKIGKERHLISPDFEISRLAICKYEEDLGNKARKARLQKQRQFEEVQCRIEEDAERKIQEIEQKVYFVTLLKTQDMELRNESQAAEIVKQHKLMKETHEQRKQEHDAKIQEAELAKRKLYLEEIKRKEKEQFERQEKLSKSVEQLEQLYTKVQADILATKYQSHMSETAKNSVNFIQNLVDDANSVRRACQQSGQVTVENSEQCGNVLEQAFNAYKLIRRELEKAEKEGREAEANSAQQARLKQEQTATQNQGATAVGTPLASSTPVPQNGRTQAAIGQAQITTSPISAAAASKRELLCVDIEAFRKYIDLQNKLKEAEKNTAVLSSTPELKKFKCDIQKAVNTPINAISPVSGDHLRDKLKRLLQLLSCQPVDVSGRTIKLDHHPLGPVFCKHLISKMIVKKGEEQVTSKHESAFAIGMVAAGLWKESPSIGEMLLAHFHAQCPYLVPYYIPRQEGQTDSDYFRSRGYRYENSVVEKHDKFLKRMSGFMRLYFSIIVSAPPRGEHPHGIEHAWMWITRVLNLEPEPDITCTMIYDCLQVTGHALCQVYNKQFLKLLHILMKEMLPKLKKVSSEAGGGALTRLQLLLETSVKRHGNIPLPDGFLEKNFWLS